MIYKSRHSRHYYSPQPSYERDSPHGEGSVLLPAGTVVRCEGRFSGAAGGFSVYALMAVVKAIEDAQAPPADVAGDEPSGSLVGPIIGIVLAIAAALVVALVYRSRRRESRQAPTLDASGDQFESVK